jgi:hypothetical protein
VSQELTSLIPAAIFCAIFLFIFGIYYTRVRRAQVGITERQDRLIEQSARQSLALERIAAALESLKELPSSK